MRWVANGVSERVCVAVWSYSFVFLCVKHSNMASDKVILKLKHAGVYRRLQLNDRPLTLREVDAFIVRALPEIGGGYVLSYVDEEGDKVIVGTDMGWVC